LPYKAEHYIGFMDVTPAHPQSVDSFKALGSAYDSFNYTVTRLGGHNWPNDVHRQQAIYENSVAKLVETKDFDIVHAHDWLTFRAAIRVKEARGCPVILHVHSVESDRAGNKPGNPLVHEIEEMALTLADRVIAVSQHTKNAIVRDYGLPADKIEIVHNSIDGSGLI